MTTATGRPTRDASRVSIRRRQTLKPHKLAGFELLQSHIEQTLPYKLRHELHALGGASAITDGPRAFYGFLRDDLAAHGALHGEVLGHLVDQLAVWFTPRLCAELPVLLPHVMRNNGCRKELCTVPSHTKGKKGRTGDPRDMWSTPTPEGYVRDDNSLIKECVKRLPIASSNPVIDGARIGAGWIACHIVAMSDATDPWLNSFVPNLVWPPTPLDKLSDVSGSVVQRRLLATSRALFGAAAGEMDLWRALGGPAGKAPTAAMNHWKTGPRFVAARRKNDRGHHVDTGRRRSGPKDQGTVRPLAL